MGAIERPCLLPESKSDSPIAARNEGRDSIPRSRCLLPEGAPSFGERSARSFRVRPASGAEVRSTGNQTAGNRTPTRGRSRDRTNRIGRPIEEHNQLGLHKIVRLVDENQDGTFDRRIVAAEDLGA